VHATKHIKQAQLREVEREGGRAFMTTLYDTSELDRDGETVDLATVRAREPLTLQIDHSHSVLSTVGLVTGIRAAGARLRGKLTFAPAGVSEIADQVYRQVEAGITSGVSIGFLGTPKQAAGGHTIWTAVEIIELSIVSVPAAPGARIDAKALRAWLGQDEAVPGLTDEPVLEIDDDLVELDVDESVMAWLRDVRARRPRTAAQRAGLVEPIFDVDPVALREALRDSVRAGLRTVAQEAAQRALNQLRGRVD
jgi:hypothetical protein